MNSLRRAYELPIGYCAYSLNSNLGSSSEAAPMKGYSEFGRQANPSHKIIRKFTYAKGDGVSVQLQVRDNETNYILEYLNVEDIRNSANGEWSILEAGLSRTINLTDGNTRKAYFGFASFNDTGTNQLFYCNGVESPRLWNGATAKISTTTATTITIAGTLTCAQRGFSASGSLIINGTTYTYSGLSSTQFTGVSGNPTGEASGSGIAQAVDTTTLSAIDKGSIVISALQRIFMAGITLTPNQVTFSDVGDLTSYAGSTPADGGFEDFPQLNGDITGLSNLDNWIIVFSKNKILAFRFDYPTSTTRVTILKEIADEGCPNPKAIRKVGDRIIYLTPNGGIKMITRIAAEDVFNISDLTEDIRSTIKNFVWDDSCLEYLPKDRILITAGKSSSDISDNDKGVMLWFSRDETGQESFNLGIHDWFIGDLCIYNSDIHFGSSLASRSFKALDGYSKNGAPYDWKRIERVEFFGNPWERKQIANFAVRGSISPGTKLIIKLKYGINGSISTQEMELKGTDSDYIVQQPLNVLGGFELGTEPLGGTIDEIGDLNPFKVIFALPEIYEREVQVSFETSGSGQQVIIDSYGFEVELTEEHIYSNELKSLGLT